MIRFQHYAPIEAASPQCFSSGDAPLFFEDAKINPESLLYRPQGFEWQRVGQRFRFDFVPVLTADANTLSQLNQAGLVQLTGVSDAIAQAWHVFNSLHNLLDLHTPTINKCRLYGCIVFPSASIDNCKGTGYN